MTQALLFKLILVFAFFFLSYTVAFAQESSPIHSFNIFQTESADNALVKQIQSLAFDNIPSLYFEGDKIVSIGGTDAIRFTCPMNKLGALEKTKSSFKDVWLLFLTIINPEDLRLLETGTFSNLKYLFFSVEFKITTC